MENIKEAREQAFKLASENYVSGLPPVGKYSSIYITATSNVKDYFQLYKNYETVLSVGSTGAQGYEALLNGAKKVDLFDINELQRLYFEYLKTAIIHLDYKTFIKYFTLKEQGLFMLKSKIKDFLSNELYDQLVYFLPKDVEAVFSPIYDYFYSGDLLTSKLFRFEHYYTVDELKKYISFYNEEQYYKLQKILRKENCEINYHIVSLSDVPSYFNGQYDLIVLDNILQYYKDIPGLDTPELVNTFIQNPLANLLTENGVIQVNYGFQVASDAFKEKFGIPYETGNVLNMMQLLEELQVGINISLVENWEGYEYCFVPGVERAITRSKTTDNLVLSYRKKSSK